MKRGMEPPVLGAKNYKTPNWRAPPSRSTNEFCFEISGLKKKGNSNFQARYELSNRSENRRGREREREPVEKSVAKC